MLKASDLGPAELTDEDVSTIDAAGNKGPGMSTAQTIVKRAGVSAVVLTALYLLLVPRGFCM